MDLRNGRQRQIERQLRLVRRCRRVASSLQYSSAGAVLPSDHQRPRSPRRTDMRVGVHCKWPGNERSLIRSYCQKDQGYARMYTRRTPLSRTGITAIAARNHPGRPAPHRSHQSSARSTHPHPQSQIQQRRRRKLSNKKRLGGSSSMGEET